MNDQIIAFLDELEKISAWGYVPRAALGLGAGGLLGAGTGALLAGPENREGGAIAGGIAGASLGLMGGIGSKALRDLKPRPFPTPPQSRAHQKYPQYTSPEIETPGWGSPAEIRSDRLAELSKLKEQIRASNIVDRTINAQIDRLNAQGKMTPELEKKFEEMRSVMMKVWDRKTSQALSPLDKQAGVRDAFYTAITGRVPLFHGTTKGIAKGVAEHGLIPQGTRGISDVLGLSGAEKGLSFLTRNPGEAKMYALQSTGLGRISKIRELLQKHVPSVAKHVEGGVIDNPMVEKQMGLFAGMVPGGKKVVRANIPRNVLRSAEGNIPELNNNAAMVRARGALTDLPDPFGRLGEQTLAWPFRNTVTMKGGVPAKFIKGSPAYQRPGLAEIKGNFAQAMKEPKQYGKDVLRSLTGVSHRPSTILKQAPL